MSLLRTVLIVGTAFTAACSSMDEDMIVEDDRADQVVDYFLPDAATNIALGELISGSIAYGRCENGDSTKVIEINCGIPWSEVGWFQISAEEVARSREAGDSVLRLHFSVTEQDEIVDRLRVSIHEVNAEGQTRKLASQNQIVDGESMQISLTSDLEHYIYVARGGTPLTSTRTAEYTLTAIVEAE